MAAFRLLLVSCVLLVFPMSSDSIPEPGKLKMEFTKNGAYQGFSKALYKDATISVRGKCVPENKAKLTIKWRLKYVQCAGLFMGVTKEDLHNLWYEYKNHEITGEHYNVQCNSPFKLSVNQSLQQEYIEPKDNNDDNETLGNTAKSSEDDTAEDGNKNKKREDDGKKQDQGEPTDQLKKNSMEKNKNSKASDNKASKGKEKRSAEDREFETLLRVKRDGDDEDDDTNDTNIPAPDPKKKNQKRKSKPRPKPHDKEGGKEGAVGAKPLEADQKVVQKPTLNDTRVPSDPKKNKIKAVIATTKRDGIYLLIVTVNSDEEFQRVELDVAMESKSGFLSATDWPLLPFYGIMSLVYLFYGIVWLLVSACNWRDLLRIQFWIGGVIALGMLEKAVFYSEYNNINNTGIPTPSLVVFAEIVSVAKRTLARMLVIIVSMGFGIVKPRLGKSLHRVLGVGALYFIIGVVEGYLRSLTLKADPSKGQLIAGIPLAVLDAAICWWIFMSLVQTTRTLRIRRNIIKLSLYRHFTNTLIFAVLASVAYMIWSIKTHKFAACIKDWSELWLDEAFWHFLFSIILLVIMVLWRPTANNQRYAFTPIVDFDDDEEDNITLSEAFDGMKMRNTRTEVIVNGDYKKKAEDDLKWVEENIPSSAADTVLPSVLDSDEELMTTKFEMSKME